MTKAATWDENIQHVSVVAGCVLRQDNKYLLVQENHPRFYGQWNVPAGHVDKNETIEQAAIREAREETGYDVALDYKIGVYHNSAEESVRHAFVARIVGGTLQFPIGEILDARWMTYDEITTLNVEGKMRAPWVFDAITTVESR